MLRRFLTWAAKRTQAGAEQHERLGLGEPEKPVKRVYCERVEHHGVP